MNAQPKALELASICEDESKSDPDDYRWQASAELQRLHAENIALRRCALKYLDYLCVSQPEEALERDLLDPEMVGNMDGEVLT